MGRARRARRIAQKAAYGGGMGMAGIGALSLLGYALIRAEAMVARRVVGQSLDGAPDDEGRYGFGPGAPIQLVVLGDSTGKGMGAEHARQTIGAIVANGVAAFSGRSVELTNVAVVGAESPHLDPQVDQALERVPAPDVAVIMIGANDVTHRVNTSVAVRHLEMAVRRLRDAGAEVVVGTCPDLGALEPVPQPLRLLARRWSRDLAAAQTVAVVEAGGRAVSVGDLLSEAFSAEPHVMFSQDRFHPSPAGYARVAAAMLPTVSAALDLFGEQSAPTRLNARRGEGVGPVAVAATRAVAVPGTEVSPAEVGGQLRGAQGRWATLRHRLRPAVPVPEADPVRADEDEAQDAPLSISSDRAGPRTAGPDVADPGTARPDTAAADGSTQNLTDPVAADRPAAPSQGVATT